MELKAKLNFKFYIVSALLLGLVIFVIYGIYFLNANEILMEDNTPMDSSTKGIFTTVLSAVALSWAMSFVTLVRQMILGQAFLMDETGIHNTLTAINVFAFIFVAPIRTIPYEAIEKITEQEGILTIVIDKSKIEAIPFLRIFVRKRYHFFAGFTAEKQEDIKACLEKHLKTQ